MKPSFRLRLALLLAFPWFVLLWVWLGPLSFVPVPWPDDSAFYFVAHEFFRWPPRWVMLPQAPFEATYAVFNFNTMPLFPILVGLGRFIGIDGSFAIKFWPLSFFAATGSLLAFAFLRSGLPWGLVALVTAVFSLDPILRWASVLVRPESFVGLCGVALVLGLTLGFPKRFRARGFWDPVAGLLAIAAYAHFNAIHLLFPVIAAFWKRPSRLIKTGLITVAYLSPWLLLVAIHPDLFIKQMGTQWKRLAVGNPWLSSPYSAVDSLMQSMGSPEPWGTPMLWATSLLGLLILAGLFTFLLYVAKPMLRYVSHVLFEGDTLIPTRSTPDLLIPAAWILGTVWLWNSKPEVWFIYFIHTAVWTFMGCFVLRAWRAKSLFTSSVSLVGCLILIFCGSVFAWTDVRQHWSLSQSPSWKWSTYHQFVDCIDRRLVLLSQALSKPKLEVWDPTFPDVTVELSRKHPDWNFTRTNDFYDRTSQAVLHGRLVDAVVVPETVNPTEVFPLRDVPMSAFPEVQSVWMHWKDYYLHELGDDPNFKPNQRHLCQIGRWSAFIYMKDKE